MTFRWRDTTPYGMANTPISSPPRSFALMLDDSRVQIWVTRLMGRKGWFLSASWPFGLDRAFLCDGTPEEAQAIAVRMVTDKAIALEKICAVFTTQEEAP